MLNRSSPVAGLYAIPPAQSSHKQVFCVAVIYIHNGMMASPEEPGVVEIFWDIAMVLWLWGGISTFGSFADMNFDFFRKERVVWVKIEPFMVLEFITYIFYILCISAWHDLEKYIPIFNIMHKLKYLMCIIVRPICEFVPINYILFSTNSLFCGFGWSPESTLVTQGWPCQGS